VLGARRRDHVTPVLHWLGDSELFWRLLSLIESTSTASPQSYLQELCVPVDSVQGRPQLRSVSTACIQLARVQTSIRQQQSFDCSGPSMGNSLPSALCDYSLSLNTFKHKRKTHLFGQWRTSPSAAVALYDFWRSGTSRLTYLLTYLLKIIADVANRQVTYESLSVMYNNCCFDGSRWIQEAQLSLTNRVMPVCKVVEVLHDFLWEYVDKKFTRDYNVILYLSIFNSFRVIRCLSQCVCPKISIFTTFLFPLGTPLLQSRKTLHKW